jgi:FkbM family methyltransferase
LTGGYEPDTTNFLDEIYRADPREGYLLDIGANIGLISIPFAILSNDPLPKVIAVEAVPDNVRVLRQNVAQNALNDSIQIRAVALGDVGEVVGIQVEGNLAAGEGTGTANILSETHGGVRQKITIHTLDSLNLPTGCKVVKIDTDGYDLKILMGSRAFLARERPVIYGEFAEHCLHWHDQSVSDVVRFAEDNGYLVWQRLSPSWTFSRSVNSATYVMDLLLLPIERNENYKKWLISS